MDTVFSIEVVTEAETVYYEYIPFECVSLAFYADARLIKSGQANTANQLMCADPRTQAAGASCCASPDSTTTSAQARCEYARAISTHSQLRPHCAFSSSFLCHLRCPPV